MKEPQFYPAKNDFFFAFVIGAMFVVTVVGAIAGYVDFARGHAGGDFAKTRAVPITLQRAHPQEPQIARAGPAR
jgi:hypothetical protein